MGYIKFDKTQLINLAYSLDKEMVRSNRSGAFSCTTIIGCNTRKYHGLLICQQPQLDGDHHVLLSKVDETIIQRDASFNLGVNKYPGSFSPKGHKYVRHFSADILPVVTYRVGGVILTKETLFVTEKDMVMIRYTLQEAHSPTRLRLQPFLAFRNLHDLSKRNIHLDTKYSAEPNGISVRLYDGYPRLYMQCSKKSAEYVHAPDWYNDLEYFHEADRGYAAQEDLYVPGFFEFPIRKGESIILSASTSEARPASLTRLFNDELKKRIPRDSFHNSLKNSASQFFVSKGDRTSIHAGFPWIDYSGRYTFISLPGLSHAAPENSLPMRVIDSMVHSMKGPWFPESYHKGQADYQAIDTPLWFFHALQHTLAGVDSKDLWQRYGGVMKRILDAYSRPDQVDLQLHENGLLHISPSSATLTWMNATSEGRPFSPRYGYVVEINALWYNALRYAIELASAGGDKEFYQRWETVAQSIEKSFTEVFWHNEGAYLADYVHDHQANLQVRPNQVIAAGLKYSPLSKNQVKQILDVAVQQLLTPRGLRSLSPRDPLYKGRYRGDVWSRDSAYHQGTVWVWPLAFFASAWIRVYGKQGKKFLKDLLKGFEETLTESGIGTVSEIFEGDPPHKACGTLSFAASLGELLRMENMLK